MDKETPAAEQATTTSTTVPSGPPKPPERPGLLGDPSSILVIIIIVVAFIFLVQRPQKRAEEEKLKALAEGMKKGDPVVSAGGIHGTVVRTDKAKGTVIVAVAKGVELEFNQTSVTAKKPDPAPAEKDEKAK